jgi:hypothetical protein
MVKDQGRRGVKETAEASASTSKLEEKVDLLESRLSESNVRNNGLCAEKLALRKELVYSVIAHATMSNAKPIS